MDRLPIPTWRVQALTMNENDWRELSATRLLQALSDRTISAMEVMDLFLAAVAAVNTAVNALVSLRPEHELRAAARAIDERRARGEFLPALAGLPMAPKDLSATAGIVTTHGSPLFATHVPTSDSLEVARLRAAGALLVGKSNTPEFGRGSHTYNRVFGPTRNPYDMRLSAGGSSGGAAVALATRMLWLADGSDMMGSLRNPAGWNNVFGLRPTFGRVPSGPRDDLFFQQLGTVGPMARHIDDLALLLSIQSGPDRRAPLAQWPRFEVGEAAGPASDLRLGWLGDLDGHLACEPGILDTCEEALHFLEGEGFTVEGTELGFSADALWEAWHVLRAFASAAELAPLAEDPDKWEQLKPEIRWEIEAGRDLSASALARASATRSHWYRQALRLFDRFDVLVLPTAQVWPFPVGESWPRTIAGRTMDTYHRWMEVVLPATLAGLPVLAAPAGFGSHGLPIGLQLIGAPGTEGLLLRLGRVIETRAPWVRQRPPVCA